MSKVKVTRLHNETKETLALWKISKSDRQSSVKTANQHWTRETSGLPRAGQSVSCDVLTSFCVRAAQMFLLLEGRQGH